MSDEVANLREGLPTVGMVAYVGLSLVMDSGMLLKRGVLGKGLVALLALEWPVLVMSALMFLESLFAIKQFAATLDWTLEEHR